MKFYPSYLPLPKVEYGFSNSNRTIQTSFESGRISQRSLATKQRDFITVVFQYTQLQLGIWESFVQTVLNNGSLEFTINLPDSITGNVQPSIVLLSEGRYDTTSVSGLLYWNVSAILIKQEKTAFTQLDMDLFDTISGEFDIALLTINDFNNIVNNQLPQI